MAKRVVYKEVVHVFSGKGVKRTENGFEEIPLGEYKTSKRLTEKGAKNYFENTDLGQSCVGIEITKHEDEVQVYYIDVDTFKELATLETKNETESEEE